MTATFKYQKKPVTRNRNIVRTGRSTHLYWEPSYTRTHSSLPGIKFSINQIFRFSTARVKIHQIPYVIFQATSQFSFKFCITFLCHDTILLKFSNWNITLWTKRAHQKKIFQTFVKFPQFLLMPVFKPQVQGLFKFCIIVQCHER